MRIIPLALLGIAAYGVFLVANMPASFLLARAQDAQPGKVEVREVGGTAWHGNASVTFNSPGGPIAIERLEWHWLPSRLAGGRFAFDITARASGIDARCEGARTLSAWEVRDLEVKGDAKALGIVVPWIAPWRPEGPVSITSQHLTTDGVEVRGEARVEWKAASVALSELKPLGSYRADIVAEGHAGQLKVTTLEGPLQISGTGTLTPPTRLAFSGEARATGDQAKALEPLLNLLGPVRADGARTLDWRVN